MTLDEAIKHAEEVAEEKENEGKLLCQSESASIGCLACAKEHYQLAEWLKELKESRMVLNKIKADIAMYEADCRLSDDEYLACEECTDNVFGSIYRIIDKYKAGEEE